MLNLLFISSFLQNFGFNIADSFFSWAFILTWIVFFRKVLKSPTFGICTEIKLLFLLFCISPVGYFLSPEYYSDFFPLVKQWIMFLTAIVFVLLTYNSHFSIDKVMKWTTLILILLALLEVVYLRFDIDLGYKAISYLKEKEGRRLTELKGGIESVGRESSHFSNILLPLVFYWLSRYLIRKNILNLLLFVILVFFLRFTYSRTGAFAFLIGLLGLLALFLKASKTYVRMQAAKVILIFSLGFSFLVMPFYSQTEFIRKTAMGQVHISPNISYVTRYNYIRSGFDIYKDNILFGTGLGMSRAHYPNYFDKYPYGGTNRANAMRGASSDVDFENLIIRFLAETGTVGTLLLVLFLASICIKILKISDRNYINSFLFLSLISVYASFIGFGAISFFHWWFIFAVSLKAIYQGPEMMIVSKKVSKIAYSDPFLTSTKPA